MEDIESILQEWMYEWDYSEPTIYPMKKDSFKRKSLDCWAAEEVFEEVKKHPKENPLEVINNLRDRADNFCCIAKTREAKELFTALYDVSTTALDFLILYKFD